MNPPVTPAMSALRFAEDDEDTLEGWLVPYGGSFEGRDSYKTYATANTRFALDLFPDGARPLMYGHGLDQDTGLTPIGRIRTLEQRDNGVWMTAQLDKANAYRNEIKELVKKGALGLSSGSLAHLVEIDARTGEWIQWPIVEGSLTPSPSNLLATIDAHTFASHYRSAGIDLPADVLARIEPQPSAELPVTPSVRADDMDDDEDESEPEYEGSYADLIDDLRELLNPSSPFSEQSYTNIIDVYPDKMPSGYVICCQYDDDDCTYWKVPYTIGADNDPGIGTPNEVEQSYQPVQKARSAIGPLTLDATMFIRHATSLNKRTQDLTERRIREGRKLSGATLRKLRDVHDGMGSAHKTLGDFLDATDSDADDAAEAARYSTPEARRRLMQECELTLVAYS